MKTAAVVTVTTGGKTLEKCLSSVANQSYPCAHYVLCDGDDDSRDFGGVACDEETV